jgi:hypothetical protein
MKTTLFTFVAMASCVLVAGNANAESVKISDANLLTKGTVTCSSAYGDNWDAFKPAYLVDNAASTANAFAFNDLDTGTATAAKWSMSITGFNSDIDTLRFFSWTAGNSRAPASVSVYYSLDSKTSLLTSDYTLAVSGATLATSSTAPNDSYANTGADGYAYAELKNLAIPTGVQSVLLVYGPQVSAGNGPALCEVQGFAAVPEPSVLALLISSGFGLLAYAWRRRR